MAEYVWQQKGWPKVKVNRAVLRDELTAFAAAFRDVKAALRQELAPEVVVRGLTDEAVLTSRIEGVFTERAKKVVLRMFEDGEKGIRAGLSAAKWMRMAKVSKPTATRDLAELVKTGAIVAVGDGSQTRYSLAVLLNEPIEGINEGINDRILRLVETHPGVGVPYLHSVVSVSRATVERALAALVAEGKVEHRGSKKTGGYFVTNHEQQSANQEKP